MAGAEQRRKVADARLAEHLLARACADYALPAKRLDASACDALCAYPWPGNVRELGNIMERIALMSDDPVVTASVLRLPPATGPAAGQADAGRPRSFPRDDETELKLRAALARTGWNIARTARELGVSRNTVYAWIGAYGLRTDRGGAPEPRARSVPPPAAVVSLQATSVPTVHWEPRPVAIMGIGVEGRPPAEGLRGRALDVVGSKLRSFGGQIEGLSPTGLVATFGLTPVEATDHLGLHAAMAIQRASEATHRSDGTAVTVRVGLHGERALVGVGGASPVLDSEFRTRAWGILDHLLDACPPGGIALSRELASKLRGRFEFASLPARVPAVRLLDLARAGHAAHDSRVPFVGRRPELDLLHHRLTAAERGRGQIVAITGEAGIGKSRLLLELRRTVDIEKFAWLEGRCLASSTGTPYFPILDLVRAACGLSDLDTPASVVEKVERTFTACGLDAAESGPSLLRLLGVGGAAARFVAPTPDDIRARIFGVVRDLLMRMSRDRPVIVVLEDAHWIDATSEAALESIAAVLATSAILLLVTYRPEYRPPWSDRAHVTQISLPPLSSEESLTVVRGLLAGDRTPDGTIPAILEKADGIPFFLEELARAVIEGDARLRSPRCWTRSRT